MPVSHCFAETYNHYSQCNRVSATPYDSRSCLIILGIILKTQCYIDKILQPVGYIFNGTSSQSKMMSDPSYCWHIYGLLPSCPSLSLVSNVSIQTTALPVAEWVCVQSWKTGSARFYPRSRLSTQPFGVFRGFLRNSRKYGLGSFRKTPTEGIPPIGLGPS